jgi:hypothetical protein
MSSCGSWSAHLHGVPNFSQQYELDFPSLTIVQVRLQDLVLGKWSSGVSFLPLHLATSVFSAICHFLLQSSGIHDMKYVPVCLSKLVCVLFINDSFGDCASCRIFLIIQLLSIVNFVYYWNEDWLSEKNERRW